MDAVSLLPDTTRPSTRPHTGATSGALALAMASIKLQSKYNLSHHTMTEARVKLPHKRWRGYRRIWRKKRTDISTRTRKKKKSKISKSFCGRSSNYWDITNLWPNLATPKSIFIWCPWSWWIAEFLIGKLSLQASTVASFYSHQYWVLKLLLSWNSKNEKYRSDV